MQDAIVVGIKHGVSSKSDLYTVICSSGNSVKLIQGAADSVLKLGEHFKAEVEDSAKISAAEHIGKSGGKKIVKAALSYANRSFAKREKFGNAGLDSITSSMQKILDSAAKTFMKKVFLAAPIIVRFHNDADGASGAYGLYTATEELLSSSYFSFKPKIFWKMHRGVSYTLSDAMEDILTIGNMESVERPLLMIIDFGTSPESNEGIRKAQEKFDIIWLDHHPMPEGFDAGSAEYVNPWMFGGDSNYTAGFLACELSKSFSGADFSCMQNASLCGDYSIYCKHDKCGSELADILDLLTSYKRVAISSYDDNLTPAEIANVLKDPEKKESLLRYAHSHMSEFLDGAIVSAKQYNGAVKIFLLDFGKLREGIDSDTKYPLPGRFASKLMERISSLSKGPSLLVLHFGKYISMRASGGAGDKIDLLAAAKRIKDSYEDVESSGGHKNALSIKLKDESGKKEIIRALLKELGVKA